MEAVTDRIHSHFNRIGGAVSSRSLGGMLDGLTPGTGYQILVPDFQRGRVWTVEQKERWVGFILEGGRSPAMFTQVIKGDFGDWLIDGQQRLFALHDFYVGKIGATFLDGTRMEAITDWTPTERRFYRRLSIPVAELSEDVSKREILQLYLSLNSAGTPHTTGELDTVRAQLADMENDDATANR